MLSKEMMEKRFIEFGSYPQTATGGVQKIRWRVLEDNAGQLLLLSEYILESHYWTDTESNITKTWKNEDILKAMIPWKNNYLRRYLNSEFYDKAFNANEKKKIVKRLNKGNGAYLHQDYIPKKMHKQNINVLTTDSYEKYEERGCGDTEDNVFLLSVDEAISYFGKSYTVLNTSWVANDERKAKPTDFVKAKGTFDPREKKYLGGYTDKKAAYYKGKEYVVVDEFTGCMDWFLRSVGANDIAHIFANAPSHQGLLSYITFLGAINAGGVFPRALSIGIRPAILINK